MSRRYKNSPIIEAICEFQFEENSEWDLTVPGLVYDRVQNEFPIRRYAARVTMGVQRGGRIDDISFKSPRDSTPTYTKPSIF